jgi:tripeptidyl-peptidase-1
MRAALLCVLLLVAGAFAGEWIQMGPADKDAMMNLRFALKQQNLDLLSETLLDVADPHSANYGKWWKKADIKELVAPAPAVSKSVADFLIANGALNVEDHRDMVKCQMPVSLVESFLQADMTEFVHASRRKHIIRTTQGYIIPAAIRNVVDFVSGMEEFPILREAKMGEPLKEGVDAAASGYITPAHIQEMYGLPSAFTENSGSSLALFEFMNYNAWSGADLARFVTEMGIPNITVNQIEGVFNTTELGGESTLDVQYGGAIAISADVWYWTVDGWMYEMCTDLEAASETPLVISMSWGWPEPWQCSGPVPIDGPACSQLDVSSAQYVERINVEFQKLGLNGITLVASSGDQGAPGDGNSQCSNNTYPLWSIFPGASPWVLSVGATMLTSVLDAEEANPDANTPPICSQIKCATTNTEGVCSYPDALITTGGGFSSYSTRPSWQDTYVSNYLKSGVTLPSSKFYNSSNRGFPDVSALGHNYVIALEGSWIPVDGTSCSAPVTAGIITLLNTYRLNNNKAPLGFINPVIYDAYASNAATFTDITKGNNQCTESCCSKYGYQATKGWDPLTGLGTPQYPALLAYVETLN